MKKMEIIMWIHVYLNGKKNFNTENSWKRNCSYETKVLISFIPTGRMWLWSPILKRKKIIMWIRIYPNWKININSKNGKKRSFSYEIKASISFIPTRNMRLWCPIMKRKEIIRWIHFYLNWWTNLDSNEW